MDPTLNRILTHLRGTLGALSDQVFEVGPAVVARTRSLAQMWTLNQVCLTEPMSVGQALALADEYQHDLPYRHLVAEDETGGEALEELAAAGWDSDREVFMELSGPADRVVPTDAVVELTEPQMLGLMRQWISEERPGTTEETLDQVEEYNRREGRIHDEARFGVLGKGGSPVAITKLRHAGAIAQVEDVYTVPEERRRGHGRMLVTHATELARAGGHELTFIVADDKDWPKGLYAALGFRPVGVTRTFHLDLPRPG